MSDDQRQGRRRRRLTATVTDLEVIRQRALLVGVALDGDVPAVAEASLDELALLTDTAGSEPVDQIVVRRPSPDPAMFVGSGKARELASEVKALDIDVVVFDNELTPAQQRNLQRMFEVDVVDRVALILDIFAQHATTREGMIQVELAQHRYRLPRLRGRGTELSRLGAGIGTRGPGESQLETDRRRIMNRIRKLERELQEIAGSRRTQSKARRRSGLPLLALVGYTNAGKSTLFNQVSAANVRVEDRLFATLDSTVRKIALPTGHDALISDTVGFVRRLPHQLVEAFRSTLEQVKEADLLLHVVDGADPDPDGQIAAVRTVLAEIGAGDVDELLVVNKLDIAPPDAVRRLVNLFPGAVTVSALTGEGIETMLESVAVALQASTVEISLVVPYDRGDALANLHRIGEVLKEEHNDSGTVVHARIPADARSNFTEFIAPATDR